ncbi:DUF2809 domain-containing protein [Flavobacterium jejuense]|uniref:DUF2809 domain-containing protein n=1 Tax=Flavobacterium jejuense TaxID=1544455 RepID=A0ABX0IKI4_9FLAO|nr:DUF2809 domain-containing protein [Flavobacterium jejuense]NHN24329.1 DUF2809 domain-containing protein [Flavobacterium jejuense]
MLTFNKKYFLLTLIIFFIEVIIALYINDNFIRPYLGDVLVVILIYCFVKTFIKIPVVTAALFVLLFSFTVELLQFLNIVKILGLEEYKIARIVIGTSFSWADLVCYTVGIGIVVWVEKKSYF